MAALPSIPGRTACAHTADLEMVRILVEEGDVDVNQVRRAASCPVRLCTQRNCCSYRPSLTFAVWCVGTCQPDSLDGDTALHGAAEEGHLDIVDYLLSLPDIDLLARNHKGKTAAYKARQKKHHEIADMIRTEVRRRTCPNRRVAGLLLGSY